MKSQRSEVIVEDWIAVAVVDHEDVEDGAADDERDQRGQEGAQPHVADQIAVEAAEDEAGQHGGEKATQTGCSRMRKLPTAAKLARAKIDPTERSMPPPSMTMVMPVTTIENSPSWRVESLTMTA